jgi:hypothetical protein
MIITWQIDKQWHSNVKYSIMFIHCITSLHLQYKRCNVSATMLNALCF